MKFDFDSCMLDLEDKPLEDPKTKEKVILKTVAVNALMKDKLLPNGNSANTGERKIELFKLSRKIYKGGKIDLTVRQTNMLMEEIKRVHTPLIVGRSCEILEGEDLKGCGKKPEKKKARK